MDENIKKEPIEEAASPETAPDTPAEKAEENTALDSFLSREQEQRKTVKPVKKRKPILIVIIALVIVAALVVTLILVRHRTYQKSEGVTDPAEITLDVGKDGVHEASVALDENGNILQNGSGSLLTYVPADIKEINVENRDGSFTVTSTTPEGEATVYKLVGFEDYTLQEGIADEIASHVSALEFTKIISANGNLSDYGLDKPLATVNVSFNDGTTALIRVGNNAAGEDTGAYVAFGSSDAVYLVSSETVKPFLYSVNSLISLDITDKMEDSDKSEFSTLTISGSRYDEPITLEPNTDKAIDASYIVTSPRRMYANATESYDIAGNIRGLYAEEVVCVNPSDNQLSSYGLSEPYASVKATYPDTEITLHASAPNDDGLIYLYNPDKNVIYTIQLAAVSWAKTGLDLLTPENPLIVNKAYVSAIDFSAADVSFKLDVTSSTETVTDGDGNEQEVTTTTATYDGKELTEQNFSIFFQNLTAIKNQGSPDGGKGSTVMSVTYSYTTDRSDDTLTVYTSDATNYILEMNGSVVGTASKAYIDSLIEGAQGLIKGENITSL